MTSEPQRYAVRVHSEPGEQLWAEVLELPGVFVTGTGMEDLRQALAEAIGLYLSEPGSERHVELGDEPGIVTEHHVLARSRQGARAKPAGPRAPGAGGKQPAPPTHRGPECRL
jgi:predicted RNase H-like HicB family nuclease